MSKKFIFSVSAINKEDLSEIVSAFGTFDVNLTLMFRDKQKLMQTQSYGLECPMLLYPNLEQDQNDHIPNNECQSIYVRLVSDATLHALLDRTGIKFNNEERFSYISQGILKTVNYLIKMNPNIIFFAAPPHHYDTWLFGRIAQFLNIKVGFLSFSIFKNIYIYCDGMPGSCQPKIIKRPTISNNERKIGITGALKTFERATYRGDLSMPATEASLYGENKSKVFRPLQSFFERPLSLKRIIYTANLYKYFNSQKIETQLENLKYWIFFLHYQPERSTLPEGGLYFNQFEAIARLRSLLPIDVTILVKEHPSTFRRLSDPRYRNKSFYRKINSLTKTFLIGFSQSSYDLIDTSQGVATITGKIAYEARCRSKPAIIFGEGKYIGPLSELGIQHMGSEKSLLSPSNELLFHPKKYANWAIEHSVGEIDEYIKDSKKIRSNAIKISVINLIREVEDE